MTPFRVLDNLNLIICFEAQPEDISMHHHFIKECGWTEDQYAEIEDFAWFSAKISAWQNGKELGSAYLGACCYKTEEEFIEIDGSGYMPQMIEEAVEEAKAHPDYQPPPEPSNRPLQLLEWVTRLTPTETGAYIISDAVMAEAKALVTALPEPGKADQQTPKLTAIRRALADLIGSYQSRQSPSEHDWKAHLLTINELADAFGLQGEIPDGLR